MAQLAQSFFRRPVLEVAPELLGKQLVRSLPAGDVFRYRITEVEAYDGEADLACHASRGRTPRTDVMYEAGGVWYIYLVYGMYHMLNIVTGESGYPAAVLIRGVETISGPGRLTKKLFINKTLNQKKAIKHNGLWIEDDGLAVSAFAVTRTPRIGVAYAKEWAEKPYRFVWQT